MFVPPMLAQQSDEAFDDDQYIKELKFGGFRCILSYIDDLHVYTRHNNEVTRQFPELQVPSFNIGTILELYVK